MSLPLLPDLPGRRPEHLGQYPRRQFTCVDGQRNRAPGDFFLRQLFITSSKKQMNIDAKFIA
nr:hypothetical protein [uncultured Dysosmobacter sp.]